MLGFIQRPLHKLQAALASERTKYENEQYWGSVSRNVAPVTFEEHKSGKYIVVDGNIYKRTIVGGVPPLGRMNGYPKGLNESFMTRLLELPTQGSQLSISLKLNPISVEKSNKLMETAHFRNEVQQVDSIQKHNKESEKVENLVSLGLQYDRASNTENFKAVREDSKRHFHSSLIVTLKSNSIEELDVLESGVLSIFGQEGVEKTIPDYLHKQVLLCAQPFNIHLEYTRIELFSEFGAVLTPSVDPNSATDKSGLYWGVDRFTNKPIIIDIDSLAAQHAFWVGPTRSGKTFTVLMMLLRYLDKPNTRVFYCTPKSDEGTDHKAVVDWLGDLAELIETGPGGNNINPMQILYDRSRLKDDINLYTMAYNRHKGTLMKVFDEWFQGTGTPNMSNFIDFSLNKCYEKAGIYRNVPSTWHNARWPVLTDLFAIWEEEKKVNKDPDDLRTIRAVLRKTYSLSEGGSLEYLNHQTDKSIDLSKRFIVLDMSGTPPEFDGAARILAAGMMGQLFSTDTSVKAILAIDEANVFLRNPLMATFIINSFAMGASQNVAFWVLSQDTAGIKKSNVAEEFQTNTFIKVVLGNNMNTANIKYLTEYLDLDQSDIKVITSSKVGEGLLVIGNKKIPMKYKPSGLELKIIKGELSDDKIISSKSEVPDLDERLIGLVMDNGYCLNKWSPGASFSQGWKVEPVSNVFGAGSVTAKVRVKDIPANQTLDHFSTVMQLAGELILGGFDNVVVNHESDVDISFESDGKKYSIEYERSGSHTEDELIQKRQRALNKYGAVVFVCASTYHKKLSGWLGDEFVVKRGQSLRDYIDAIK